MTLLLVASSALAAGLSGLAVPEPLGAFAGPSAGGALGLATNPASARPAHAEAALDLGLMRTHLRYQLEGEEPSESFGLAPLPSLAAALPVGPVGVGLAFFVPNARTGDAPPDDSPARLYAGQSSIMLIEGDLSAAAAWGPLSLGGALRVGRAQVASRLKYDTGVLLTDILGAEAEVPLRSDFLEGTQAYDMRGIVLGGAGGLRLRPERGPDLDLALRSALRGTLTGPFSLAPSDDMNVAVEGEASLPMAWPAEILLAGAWPLGAWRPGGELTFTRWSSLYRLETELDDLSVRSEDPLFQALLDSYGLSQADFLQGIGPVPIETGLSNILAGGVWVDWLGQGAQGRAGVWVTPAAIPTEYVNPGNADFGSIDLRLAGAKQWRRLVLAGSLDAFLCPARVVEDSIYSQQAGVESGRALPPAKGTYALSALRLGLTAAVRGDAPEQPGLW